MWVIAGSSPASTSSRLDRKAARSRLRHIQVTVSKHIKNQKMTDYKLEYVTRLFEKTNNKKIENYVITRLWHKLDNVDIKMVPQQYVSRDNSKYALTDIYFPQFGICVEVNEPAHYFTQEKIELTLKEIKKLSKKYPAK